MHLSPRTTTFARETFDQMFEEFQPLAQRHWEEIALHQDTIPLDPDWDMYRRAEASGILHIHSVRTHGVLVGYSIFFVLRHPHYNHRWANNDILWIAPENRDGRVGMKLVRFSSAELRVDGPVVIHYHVKAAHPALQRVLEHEGYALVEYGLSKRIG